MRNCSIGFCLVLVCFFAGCGSGNDLPEGETGTVRGRVTFEGKPVVPEGSVVVFMRDKGGYIATGKVTSGGEYLLYMRDGLQVVVGTYRVSVTPPDPLVKMDQDEIMRLHQAGKLTDPASIKEIPERYRNPENSTLVCDVKAGSNTFDIDMKP